MKFNKEKSVCLQEALLKMAFPVEKAAVKGVVVEISVIVL